MGNQIKKQISRFPADNRLIIIELLEKYGIKETKEECFEKMSKGQKTLRGTMAKTINRLGRNTITTNQFAKIIKDELSLETAKARLMTEEVQTRIIDRMTKNSYAPSSTQKNSQKEKGPKYTDAYRESL